MPNLTVLQKVVEFPIMFGFDIEVTDYIKKF